MGGAGGSRGRDSHRDGTVRQRLRARPDVRRRPPRGIQRRQRDARPRQSGRRAAHVGGGLGPERVRTDGSGPGFGLAVAVLAVLGVAVLAARRR
ncbi:MAG: hypothetical protein BRD23_05540 [Halobacteriales archaeon SW_9_67_25]|nr:MAG: hypothetical protein BRD23_05540 [Halobacteriales archaeon SW_9_67_25]